MRIEKRFLSYGHDLDTDISPLHAGLLHTVDFNTDFIGRDALLEQQQKPLQSIIASLVLNNSDAVPLGSEPVYLENEIIGKSTSATFGYRVGKPIALVTLSNGDVINTLQQNPQLNASLDIAGQRFDGTLINGPAYN